MSLYYPANTSIFTQYCRSLCIIQIQFRSRIVMQIQHIPTSVMVTSTGRIDQTGRVILFGPLHYFRSFKLSPSFIKWNPCANARIRVQCIHDFLPFLPVTSFRFRTSLHFSALKIFPVLPFRVTVTAGHILPYNDT